MNHTQHNRKTFQSGTRDCITEKINLIKEHDATWKRFLVNAQLIHALSGSGLTKVIKKQSQAPPKTPHDHATYNSQRTHQPQTTNPTQPHKDVSNKQSNSCLDTAFLPLF